jgi:uncharacterized protein
MITACGQLGQGPAGSLPRDVHAKPDAREVAARPCRYGDVARCVARCREKDASSCNGAGALYEFGHPTTDDQIAIDPATASSFYQLACDAGYGPGCNNLGWMYLGGRGVARNEPKAMQLFVYAYDASKLACIQGDMSACVLAGDLLYEGRGVNEDEAAALAYFERACAGGERSGCDRAFRAR